MVAIIEVCEMANGADIEKAYALIIGISEYKDPAPPRLSSSEEYVVTFHFTNYNRKAFILRSLKAVRA